LNYNRFVVKGRCRVQRICERVNAKGRRDRGKAVKEVEPRGMRPLYTNIDKICKIFYVAVW